MSQLFLVFETRGVRSSELDKLIKINGFVQAIKNTARVESVIPKSSYFDSGKYLPDINLGGVNQVIVLGSTYPEILLAALMWLADAGVKVLVMPELLALMGSDIHNLQSSITTVLGEGCVATVKDFLS